MEGIKYVTDDKNRKVAVQIDLNQYGQLWEEFQEMMNESQKVSEPAPVGYSTKGNAINQDDLKELVTSASERVKSGKYVSQEDLEKEVNKW